MNWQETVLKTTEELKPYHFADSYEVGDYNAPIKVNEEVWDIPKLLKTQAEISFKAGIREVVEWIEDCKETLMGFPIINADEWQAKLKEWGIE